MATHKLCRVGILASQANEVPTPRSNFHPSLLGIEEGQSFVLTINRH